LAHLKRHCRAHVIDGFFFAAIGAEANIVNRKADFLKYRDDRQLDLSPNPFGHLDAFSHHQKRSAVLNIQAAVE
jgi:hypothetical protein